MVTVREVARRAGVSIATVSRVYNHLGNVSTETRQRVEEVIKALHYSPNHSAAELGRNRHSALPRNLGSSENAASGHFIAQQTANRKIESIDVRALIRENLRLKSLIASLKSAGTSPRQP